MTLIVICPACDQEFDIDDDVELSEVVECSNCERELEVVSIDPMMLAEWDEEEK